jgi:hypothetical protein
MASKPLSDTTCQQTLDAIAKHGSVTAAARAFGTSRTTFQSRASEAVRRGFTAKADKDSSNIEPIKLAQDRIRSLESIISTHEKETLNEHYIKRAILELASMKPRVPAWLIAESPTKSSPGIPTILLSDLHWGEVVDPEQIGGVNEYNIGIAQKRLRRVIEVAVDLLQNHMVNPSYPGIVLALGGDMVSGDIHDELVATNDKEIMPVVVDLWGSLAWAIETLANKFGKVFVPAVTGNHARTTHKIRMKGRNYTSFDWLVYQFLAKRFEGDQRISFFVPDGPDALYSIYGHKYLLCHGDRLGRGGDGIIGALGPILRGDHKKRSRNAQIGMSYDTLVIGHFHQLMQTQRLIVNGSLVGYNEFAYNENFGFEAPRQALWLTHPDRGITFHMPVQAGDGNGVSKAPEREWVKWAG